LFQYFGGIHPTKVSHPKGAGSTFLQNITTNLYSTMQKPRKDHHLKNHCKNLKTYTSHLLDGVTVCVFVCERECGGGRWGEITYILSTIGSYTTRGAQIFQKSTSHLKILTDMTGRLKTHKY